MTLLGFYSTDEWYMILLASDLGFSRSVHHQLFAGRMMVTGQATRMVHVLG